MIKKVLLGAVLALALTLAYVTSPSSDSSFKDKAQATVMVVNRAKNSGGTGSVIDSGQQSHVLTNSHVCNVVKNGGYVISDSGRAFTVKSYQPSELHDLCLITVVGNLNKGRGVKLAPYEPELYSQATISGHPALLPTIITVGHFSSEVFGQVLTGFKKCSPEDFREFPMECMILGGLPVVKTYEMQVVSATIQPGSSGSAVYDDEGNLGGVVFAGSGQIGYAMIVPYSYVYLFLNSELKTITPLFPKDNPGLEVEPSISHVREVCKSNVIPDLKRVCSLVSASWSWSVYAN